MGHVRRNNERNLRFKSKKLISNLCPPAPLQNAKSFLILVNARLRKIGS